MSSGLCIFIRSVALFATVLMPQHIVATCVASQASVVVDADSNAKGVDSFLAASTRQEIGSMFKQAMVVAINA